MAPSAPWLPAFIIANRIAEGLWHSESAPWLHESAGLCLYTTVGHEAHLRTDSSVWLYAPVDPLRNPDKYQWQLAGPREHWAAILIGSKRYPKLRELLPTREPGTPDCSQCNGTGCVLAQMQCPKCGGLGWVPEEAA